MFISPDLNEVLVEVKATEARIIEDEEVQANQLLYPNGEFRLPERTNDPDDAGFDVFMPYDLDIVVDAIPVVVKIPLNLMIQISTRFPFYFECTGKSGLGSRGMVVHAGIIDKNYRGIIHVNAVFNRSINIKKGQKIAQLIPHSFMLSDGVKFQYAKVINFESARGVGGFGSSGL
jgi:dUTPase